MRQSSVNEEKDKKNANNPAKDTGKKGEKKKTRGGGKSGDNEADKRKSRRTTAEKEADDAKAEKEQGKGAKKALRHAVKKAVKKSRKQIAQALVSQVVGGDSRSAAMMLSLIDKKNAGVDEEEQSGPTLAERWAAEARWDPSMEGSSETGCGGREPETDAGEADGS